jgi:ABC-type Fe3+/spermidine/putrescine transport system ATPase subunit
MQVELRRIQQELKITTVYVTHDQTEAMNMSDRIVVMNTGRIEQIGSAEGIYNSPETRFVADFVGQINLLDGEVTGTDGDHILVRTADTDIRVVQKNVAPIGSTCVGVRPEQLQLVSPDSAPPDFNVLQGKLVGRTFAGNLTRLFIEIGLDKPVVIECKPQDAPTEIGIELSIGWPIEQSTLLNK